ncbi:MAG: precorrin-6Y C5,15-methyltransferase (decarboxylating) subunit CbiT [Mobilicoccus sp.]|nr:precorrin-6Y C5,15-methyltransferase (decarboxylating) subunit CbiT [Mobilicoccus sp.]
MSDLPCTPGLPDDTFEHDGQITKREVRAVTLAHLAPRPGEMLWDIGGGSGSIGIEWMRAHPLCRAVTVEHHPQRAARIRANAERLAPGLAVAEGRAPGALTGLPTPDAIFVGGGLTAPGVLDACLAALRPGGRLVANAVTLETEAVLLEAYRSHGGTLVRLGVEHTSPVGRFTAWTPARPITVWSATIGA